MRRRSCFPVLISAIILLAAAWLGWLYWQQIPRPPVAEPTVWHTIPVTVPVTIPVTVEPTMTPLLPVTEAPPVETALPPATAIPTIPIIIPSLTPEPVISLLVLPREPECIVYLCNHDFCRVLSRKCGNPRFDMIFPALRNTALPVITIPPWGNDNQAPPLPPGPPHGTIIPGGTPRP